MAPDAGTGEIFSATYSGSPVFELNVGGNHVMRRRQDHWINATHILKVAGYDKPARTRILEREVQKGTHEKVQGGYGKYQGTWVPLKDGRALAEANRVLDALRPLFDYVPGDISPPPAPKHTTNSNKPRVPKPPAKKVAKPKVNPAYSQMSEDYDNNSTQLHDDDSQDALTIASDSYMHEEDNYGGPQYGQGPPSRKRKRGDNDQRHTIYADALLDYFVLSDSDTPILTTPPELPHDFDINQRIDNKGHRCLHWAAAMADVNMIRFFLKQNADVSLGNDRGETPLIKSVLFVNNFDKDTMGTVLEKLLPSITHCDNYNSSILHHIAMSTKSKSKRKCAHYYLEVVLNKLAEVFAPQEFAKFVNQLDQNGDTALHIVARHNAKRCIRSLQGRGVRGDIFNESGETADLILQKSRLSQFDPLSSSPVGPAPDSINGHDLVRSSKNNGAPNYHSHAARSFSQQYNTIAQDTGLQLALAIESEAREKDDDLSEGQRLQQQADVERQRVRHETFQCFNNGIEDYNEDEERRMREEEQRLISESESLSEQIQHKELHHTIRSEEQTLPPSIHNIANGAVADDAELVAAGSMALLLSGEQRKRRKLTVEVVEAQGAAGMSLHGEKLKRLVSGTCGVPVEEVPMLAPELLDELQQSKVEGGRDGVLS